MSEKLSILELTYMGKGVLEQIFKPVINSIFSEILTIQKYISDKIINLSYMKNNILLSTSSSSNVIEGYIRSCMSKKLSMISCKLFSDRFNRIGTLKCVLTNLFEVESKKAIELKMVDKILYINKYKISIIAHNDIYS